MHFDKQWCHHVPFVGLRTIPFHCWGVTVWCWIARDCIKISSELSEIKQTSRNGHFRALQKNQKAEIKSNRTTATWNKNYFFDRSEKTMIEEIIYVIIQYNVIIFIWIFQLKFSEKTLKFNLGQIQGLNPMLESWILHLMRQLHEKHNFCWFYLENQKSTNLGPEAEFWIKTMKSVCSVPSIAAVLSLAASNVQNVIQNTCSVLAQCFRKFFFLIRQKRSTNRRRTSATNGWQFWQYCSLKIIDGQNLKPACTILL